MYKYSYYITCLHVEDTALWLLNMDRYNTKEAIAMQSDDQAVVNLFFLKTKSGTLKKYAAGGADEIRRRLSKFSTAAVPHKFDAARRRNSMAQGSILCSK